MWGQTSKPHPFEKSSRIYGYYSKYVCYNSYSKQESRTRISICSPQPVWLSSAQRSQLARQQWFQRFPGAILPLPLPKHRPPSVEQSCRSAEEREIPGQQFLKLLSWSVRISQWRTPHGNGSWRVCIPLSASAHANLWPPEGCARESNRVQAARRGRSIRDSL
jgi:hypothetical protein